MTVSLGARGVGARVARHSSAQILGELLLLFFFLSLLAGRFSLSRLDNSSSVQNGLDLRWLFLVGGYFGLVLLHLELRNRLAQRIKMVGVIPFLMWCAWLAISAQWAPESARTDQAVIDLVFLAGLVLMSWVAMARLPEGSLDRVWTWVLITGLVYFALAIASGPDDQGRYAAPGGGPNTFVRIMVAASIAALYLAVVKRRNWALLTIPVFAIGASLSGSRGGLLSAFLVLAIFLVPIVRRLRTWQTFVMGVFCALGIVAAFFRRDGYVVHFVQERFIQQTLIEGYSSGRDVITEQAWQMFQQNPVAGVGLDGYYALQLGTQAEHPHNLVLATLAEGGLVGGLLLVAALARLLTTIIDRYLPTGPLFALVTGLYFLGASMFSGDYYDTRFMWFFLGLSAFGAIRARLDRDSGQS